MFCWVYYYLIFAILPRIPHGGLDKTVKEIVCVSQHTIASPCKTSLAGLNTHDRSRARLVY